MPFPSAHPSAHLSRQKTWAIFGQWHFYILVKASDGQQVHQDQMFSFWNAVGSAIIKWLKAVEFNLQGIVMLDVWKTIYSNQQETLYNQV